MNRVVLDASALLAVANNERGADVVMTERIGAIVSAVNHAEVISKLLRSDLMLNDIDQFLIDVFPRVIPFDREQANVTGRIHAQTRKQSLSYADCACLALASVHQIPVLTGDRKWLEISTEVVNVVVKLFR